MALPSIRAVRLVTLPHFRSSGLDFSLSFPARATCPPLPGSQPHAQMGGALIGEREAGIHGDAKLLYKMRQVLKKYIIFFLTLRHFRGNSLFA